MEPVVDFVERCFSSISQEEKQEAFKSAYDLAIILRKLEFSNDDLIVSLLDSDEHLSESQKIIIRLRVKEIFEEKK
jgi:hypothetical protein